MFLICMEYPGGVAKKYPPTLAVWLLWIICISQLSHRLTESEKFFLRVLDFLEYVQHSSPIVSEPEMADL